jgi:DNA-binding NarL/FixJ family response regulator
VALGDLKLDLKYEGKRPDPRGRSNRAVRTLAVDDQEPFREALSDLVAAVPGFTLVGAASSGQEALRDVERLAPQLVLMDMMMPDINGIDAARVILSRHPGLVVVLVSVDDPALYLEDDELANAVTCARKQDLCGDALRRFWEMRH